MDTMLKVMGIVEANYPETLKIAYVINGKVFLSTFRQRQNGCHFADNILKFMLNENDCILTQILLKFHWGLFENMPALIQAMAWHLTGDKPLPEHKLTKVSDATWYP